MEPTADRDSSCETCSVGPAVDTDRRPLAEDLGRPRGRSNYIARRDSLGTVSRKWITERRVIKVLVEPQGVIVSITTKTYSHLFIVSKRFIGRRRILTKDRIVARAGYSTPRVLSLIQEVYPNGV